MSPLDLSILAAVEAEPGQWTIRELAEDLDVTHSTAARAVQRLRDAGKVVRLSPTPRKNVAASSRVRELVKGAPGEWTLKELGAAAGCTARNAHTALARYGLLHLLRRAA